MDHPLIHDRGRGPEIQGTRITIANLIPHFFEPDVTEASICLRYDLTPEQVAAARAYILDQPEVLDRYILIDESTPPINPPEFLAKFEKAREAFFHFRDWLRRRKAEEARELNDVDRGRGVGPDSGDRLTYKQWLAEQEAAVGSES